nr:hypothetical protein pPsy0462a_00068 [Pseudomonas syringae]
MSEFSSTAEPKASTIERPAPTPAPGPKVWQRPIVMGLSLPWLIGIALLLALVGWYLFAPKKARQSIVWPLKMTWNSSPCLLNSQVPTLLLAPLPSLIWARSKRGRVHDRRGTYLRRG